MRKDLADVRAVQKEERELMELYHKEQSLLREKSELENAQRVSLQEQRNSQAEELVQQKEQNPAQSDACYMERVKDPNMSQLYFSSIGQSAREHVVDRITQILASRSVPVETIDLAAGAEDKRAARDHMESLSGSSELPQLFLRGNYIGNTVIFGIILVV